MLKVFSTSWYDRVKKPVGDTAQASFFFARRELEPRPFIINFKPRASKPNFMGDTWVDHFQVDGTAWLPGLLRPTSQQSPKWVASVGTAFRFSYTDYTDPSGYYPLDWLCSLPVFEGDSLHRISQPYYDEQTHCWTYASYWGDNGQMAYVQAEFWESSRKGNSHIDFHKYVYVKTSSTDWYKQAEIPVILPTLSGYEIRKSDPSLRVDGTFRFYFSDLTAQDHHDCREALIAYCRWLEEVIRLGRIPSTEKVSGFRYLIPGAPDELNIQALFRLKNRMALEMMLDEPDVDLVQLLGDATQSAADAALKFTGNTGSLIKELIQLKETLLDLYKLLQGEVSLDSLADLWLSARFGLKLTYQDTVELAKSFLNEVHSPSRLYNVARGGHTQIASARCKLYFDPNTRNQFASVMSKLMEWDLFPSLANVWDIVPYSFVVDWFIDIEGILSSIDSRTYLSVMEVFATCYTVKNTWVRRSSTWLGLNGSFRFSHFIRECPTEPYQPYPSFSGSLPSFKNIIDGTALIIQQRK